MLNLGGFRESEDPVWAGNIFTFLLLIGGNNGSYKIVCLLTIRKFKEASCRETFIFFRSITQFIFSVVSAPTELLFKTSENYNKKARYSNEKLMEWNARK